MPKIWRDIGQRMQFKIDIQMIEASRLWILAGKKTYEKRKAVLECFRKNFDIWQRFLRRL